MALVSMKNLLAPATNSVHLATICFVVVLFAVLRFSGGYISVRAPGGSSQSSTKATAPKINFDPNADPLDSLGVERYKASKSDTTAVEIPADEAEDFEKVMRTHKSSSAAKVPPRERVKPPAQEGDATAGLDDIEKTLGLR